MHAKCVKKHVKIIPAVDTRTGTPTTSGATRHCGAGVQLP